MKMSLLVLLLIGLCGAAGAKPWWTRGVESNDNDFLPPEVAFRVAARVDGQVVRVRWVIADGYYLYRRRIEIRAESPDLVLSPAVLPRGTQKIDAFQGAQEIYQQQVEATVPYSTVDGGAHPLQIKVTYQGCAEAGLCYPPITKVIFPQRGALPGAAPTIGSASAPSTWVRFGILAGAGAFLLAGLMLRKGRKLELPAA
jgi:thioredoxin:protein disulfide reductase